MENFIHPLRSILDNLANFLERKSTKSAILTRGTHTYLLWRATYWRGQVWQSDPNGHRAKFYLIIEAEKRQKWVLKYTNREI